MLYCLGFDQFKLNHLSISSTSHAQIFCKIVTLTLLDVFIACYVQYLLSEKKKKSFGPSLNQSRPNFL